jgi:quinol monooxygenase YgiN
MDQSSEKVCHCNESMEDYMISVLAFVQVKPGRRADLLEIFKDNMIKVRKEQGCREYFPAVDVPAGLPAQVLNENMVTIIEKWDSLDALREHLKAPHMQAYRERVKDLVAGTELKILEEA